MIDVFVFRYSELELRIIIIDLPTDWPQIIHPVARTKKKKYLPLPKLTYPYLILEIKDTVRSFGMFH